MLRKFHSRRLCFRVHTFNDIRTGRLLNCPRVDGLSLHPLCHDGGLAECGDFVRSYVPYVSGAFVALVDGAGRLCIAVEIRRNG